MQENLLTKIKKNSDEIILKKILFTSFCISIIEGSGAIGGGRIGVCSFDWFIGVTDGGLLLNVHFNLNK